MFDNRFEKAIRYTCPFVAGKRDRCYRDVVFGVALIRRRQGAV